MEMNANFQMVVEFFKNYLSHIFLFLRGMSMRGSKRRSLFTSIKWSLSDLIFYKHYSPGHDYVISIRHVQKPWLGIRKLQNTLRVSTEAEELKLFRLYYIHIFKSHSRSKNKEWFFKRVINIPIPQTINWQFCSKVFWLVFMATILFVITVRQCK